MPRPFHIPLFDHPNNSLRSLQIMKLFIMYHRKVGLEVTLLICIREVLDSDRGGVVG
jgi:hypothetical protein